METADVLVIGAGVAGIGVAAALAGDARTLVLEREAHPGMHATGRSAAILIDGYGAPAIRALTAASRPWYEGADADAFGGPLVAPRGELLVARPDQTDLLARLGAELSLPAIGPEAALARVPVLNPAALAGALWDEAALDLDVDRLLGGWLRALRARGGRLVAGAEARAIRRTGGAWEVETPAGAFRAPVLVDAAGAWADVVADLAGAPPLGLTPLRRSAALLPAPAGRDVRAWPLFGGIAEDWYARPMGGKLMVSPADEDPVAPHDAYADDMVLAEGLARFEAATTLEVTRVERSWAGLRSFLPDRTPACGFDPAAEGFFWLAGQGGYGVQTAPALSALAADLILGRPPRVAPETVAALDPARFRGPRRGD